MSEEEKIDPVCSVHGLRLSEHQCIFCALCFKPLTIDQCHVNRKGIRRAVCNDCVEMEKKAKPELRALTWIHPQVLAGLFGIPYGLYMLFKHFFG